MSSPFASSVSLPSLARPRLCYLAYPTSLTLQAANAIQAYLTVRELRSLCPDLLVIVPRFLREPSSFEEVGALHLPRIPIGKVSRFHHNQLTGLRPFDTTAACACKPRLRGPSSAASDVHPMSM